MIKVHSILVILAVLIAASLACSMPLAPAKSPAAPTFTPPSTGNPTVANPTAESPMVTVTTKPAAVNTPLPPTQSVQIIPTVNVNNTSCNLAEFVSDVSYVDDTVVPAGTGFVKKWRIKNTGSCPWTSGYKLVFVSGDAMGAPGSTQLTTEGIPPGSSVDATVNLVAPTDPGTYRGNYKLQSSDGITFGIEPASSVFYVRIVVEGQNGQQGGNNPAVESNVPVLARNMKLTSPYMKGNDVSMLQNRLLERGYDIVGTADGIFGPKTDKAVRQFQADQGLVVDGIVGAKTWNALWI